MIYDFGEFTLDSDRRVLYRGSEAVSIQPKVFDLLAVLVASSNRTVSHETLRTEVWPNTFVEETNLRFCIHSLRKVLGRLPDGSQPIENRPRVGYRLVLPVSVRPAEEPDQSSSGTGIESAPVSLPRGIRRTKLRWAVIAFSAVILSVVSYAWISTRRDESHNRDSIESVAVIPFAAPGDTTADGLNSAVIANLEKFRTVKVVRVERNAVGNGGSEDADVDVPALNADAILTGSYRTEGDSARTRVTLRRARDGVTILDETFVTSRPAPLALETAVSARIARLLWQKFETAAEDRRLRATERSGEAISQYLLARGLWRSAEYSRRKELVSLFQKITATEPDWALALSGSAEARLIADSGEIDWSNAEKEARRALSLDPQSAQALGVLAEIGYRRDRAWESAESELRSALTIDPDYALNHWRYSELLRIQRRFGEAHQRIDRAIELEPFSPLFYVSLCELFRFEGELGKALEACSAADDLEPGFWRTPKAKFWVLVESGRFSELAALVLDPVPVADRPEHPINAAVERNDLRPYWEYSLREYRARGKSDPRPISIGRLYLLLGDQRRALDYLEQARETARDGDLPSLNADPIYSPLRSNPRFRELMKRVGLDSGD